MNLREAFRLTPREDVIARHILCGGRVKGIEIALGCKPSTIRTHIRSILLKSKTDTVRDFVRAVAIRDGWNVKPYSEGL